MITGHYHHVSGGGQKQKQGTLRSICTAIPPRWRPHRHHRSGCIASQVAGGRCCACGNHRTHQAKRTIAQQMRHPTKSCKHRRVRRHPQIHSDSGHYQAFSEGAKQTHDEILKQARMKVHAPKSLPQGSGARISDLVFTQIQHSKRGIVPVDVPMPSKNTKRK